MDRPRPGGGEKQISEFHRLIEEQIPRLRRYARALSRNPDRADDLVQNTLVWALAKQHLWQPGTNLRAWLFTLMHYQNVNSGATESAGRTAVDVEKLSSALIATTDPAAILSVPIGTVRSRLSRGREILRRLMNITGKDNTKAAKPTIVALAA
jgi:RNA polymerase sigma-70 factor, ECF subfamily